MKNFLISTGNAQLAASSAYFTVFFSILLHITNLAISDTQGILGSNDIGEKKHKNAFMKFKQGIVLGIALFFITCVLPSFFYAGFLTYFLDIDEGLAISSQKMVIWALPAMFVRTVNDSLKTFLQNHKFSRMLGYCYVGLITCFTILGGVLVFIVKLEESSVGVVLFFFELSGVLFGTYFFLQLKKKEGWEEVNYSLSEVSKDFEIFVENFISFWIMDSPIFLMYEFQNVIISFTYSNEQIAVYTLNSTLTFVITSLSSGFTIQTRTMINREIGRKNFEKVIHYLKGFQIFFVVLGVVAGVFIFIGFSLLVFFGFYGEESSSLRSYMFYLGLIFLFRTFIPFYSGFLMNSIKSAGMTDIGQYLATIPRLLGSGFCYLICLYFGYGVLGLIISETFSGGGIIWAINSYKFSKFFFKKNW